MLSGVVLVLLLFISIRIAEQPVSYDGAMNLQVAEHLASGGGYARPYHGIRPFPHEIQTNAPYVLLAALVFALGGVGLFTAQLPNLIYLAFACVVAAAAFRKDSLREPWPWLAALAVLVTPGLLDWGMNAYGELPALTWWLLGTVVLLGRPVTAPRIALAGGCLGLAMITKTVMLLPVACTLALSLIHI